jgi:hypothetical protein
MVTDNALNENNKGITSGYKSIVYTANKDGVYRKVSRKGWEPANIALGMAWESVNEIIEQTKKKVISGELSPIAFFMEKNQFSIARLSYMTGFSKRKIRKHLHPKAFAKINQETLETYSKAFQTTPEQFIKPFQHFIKLIDEKGSKT